MSEVAWIQPTYRDGRHGLQAIRRLNDIPAAPHIDATSIDRVAGMQQADGSFATSAQALKDLSELLEWPSIARWYVPDHDTETTWQKPPQPARVGYGHFLAHKPEGRHLIGKPM